MKTPQQIRNEVKKGDNYATDEWILSLFENWFDPCPLDENPKFDGLEIEWKDKTFVNPPYSKPINWVKKAIEESNKGKMIVLLLRVDTSTEWFKLLINADAHILWINKRLKHRTGSPANFPSMLVILNKQELLSKIGDVQRSNYRSKIMRGGAIYSYQVKRKI